MSAASYLSTFQPSFLPTILTTFLCIFLTTFLFTFLLELEMVRPHLRLNMPQRLLGLQLMVQPELYMPLLPGQPAWLFTSPPLNSCHKSPFNIAECLAIVHDNSVRHAQSQCAITFSAGTT